VFVSCTTVGYGDMVPSTPAARLFLICYSLLGIVAMVQVSCEMGEILVTASEAPAEWFLRTVALRLCPSLFPGLDSAIWAAHGHMTDPERQRRTLWVGDLCQSTEPESYVCSLLENDVGRRIEKVTMHADGVWGLVTFHEGATQSLQIALQSPPQDTHTLLAADPVVVGRKSLEGSSGQARMRVVLAIGVWLWLLLGLGPLYALSAHAWTYEQSVYFTFITMTTIGFGDFFPYNDGAKYTLSTCVPAANAPADVHCAFKDPSNFEDCAPSRYMPGKELCVVNKPSNSPQDHQVYVWCVGVTIIMLALAAFSFMASAIGDMVQEHREMAAMAACAEEQPNMTDLRRKMQPQRDNVRQKADPQSA
jgi:hypothetical protein